MLIRSANEAKAGHVLASDDSSELGYRLYYLFSVVC